MFLVLNDFVELLKMSRFSGSSERYKELKAPSKEYTCF